MVDPGILTKPDCLYYVRGWLRPGPNGWFAFEDGSCVMNSPFSRATGTNQFSEAVRMLGFARHEDQAAKIVTVNLYYQTVEDQEERIHAELLASAKAKLSVEELKAVRRET